MKRSNLQKQKGAVLVVALIILAVVTILGVAGMRNSTLELRMATSLRDRTLAFQVAESALARIEQRIYNAPFPLGSFLTNNCPYAGQPAQIGGEGAVRSTGCFTADCATGLCFSGQFINPERLTDCRLMTDPPPDDPVQNPQQLWRASQAWGNHQIETVTIQSGGPAGGNQAIEAEYLVEFLCFVPRSTARVADEEDMLPLYRVTVRATTALDRAEVVLQSTFEGPSF